MQLFLLIKILLIPLILLDHQAQAVSYKELEDLFANAPVASVYALGVKYADGDGVTRDEKISLALITFAAEGGCLEAQRLLGTMYLTGAGGVGRDKQKAQRYFEMAAEQGDPQSQEALTNFQKQSAQAYQALANHNHQLDLPKQEVTGLNSKVTFDKLQSQIKNIDMRINTLVQDYRDIGRSMREQAWPNDVLTRMSWDSHGINQDIDRLKKEKAALIVEQDKLMQQNSLY